MFVRGCGRIAYVLLHLYVYAYSMSVLNTLKSTYQKKILRRLGPVFFLLFLLQPIFYQSGRPSPIRRAPLLHLCSSGQECIPCPLPHMVGSQWLDAWLLMIEPSLVNRCYHLCKPLPVPFAHRPLGRCKRRNYLITKRDAAWNPRLNDNWMQYFGPQDEKKKTLFPGFVSAGHSGFQLWWPFPESNARH